jgi:hypothetical protein
MKLTWFALMYIAALGLVTLLNKREFRRSPEKGVRYQALPIIYKLGCWCGVIPIFVAVAFWGGLLFFVALIAYGVLEVLCVRWYEKNGYLPRASE